MDVLCHGKSVFYRFLTECSKIAFMRLLIGTRTHVSSMSSDTARLLNSLCTECGGKLLVDSINGEQLCGDCGVVCAISYPVSPQNAPLHSRSEPKSNLVYDAQLSTLIAGTNMDANGKAIPGNRGFDQLRRLNSITISRDSKTNNGRKAIAEIDRIASAMALPVTVSSQAQEVYRRGLKEGVIRGKSIVNMAAATILIASGIVGVSCSLDEMERVVDSVSGRMTRKYYRLLIRLMNLEPARASPSMHISRIAGRAGLSTKVERRALEILEAVRDSQTLGDKRTLPLAGAALYLASIETGERINQLRLAYAAGTTPITIRKRSADIAAILTSAREARALLVQLRTEERRPEALAQTLARTHPVPIGVISTG